MSFMQTISIVLLVILSTVITSQLVERGIITADNIQKNIKISSKVQEKKPVQKPTIKEKEIEEPKLIIETEYSPKTIKSQKVQVEINQCFTIPFKRSKRGERYKLKKIGRETLYKNIVPLLLENLSIKIKVIGHSNKDVKNNNETNNIEVSKKRAKKIKKLLTKHDINHNRIMLDWKGSSEPIEDDEFDGRNRRVQIKIISID